MILCDERGAAWECLDAGGCATTAVNGGGNATAFRVLKCKPVDDPDAAPREIRIPAGVDFHDRLVQQWMMWTARKIW